MQNKAILENVDNEFLFLFLNLLYFQSTTVVVAHSPTPSAVKIIAFSNGDG